MALRSNYPPRCLNSVQLKPANWLKHGKICCSANVAATAASNEHLPPATLSQQTFSSVQFQIQPELSIPSVHPSTWPRCNMSEKPLCVAVLRARTHSPPPTISLLPCSCCLSVTLCRHRDANCCWRCVDVGFANFLRDLWAARSALIYAKLFTNWLHY